MSRWTEEQIPDQTGRTVIITGANSGIGFEAARALAKKGARVIMACRNASKATKALAHLQRQVPGADVIFKQLDLADLSSIERFAEDILANEPRVDVLINNAGVMAIPRRETKDGFEMQLGTNHLGHFALTSFLLERLAQSGQGRVVNVSSMAHRFGKMNFADIHGQSTYHKWRAYGQSKLANLLFTKELDRRLRAAKVPVLSVACHPGWASTNLQSVGPEMENSTLMARLSALMNMLFAQSAKQGALPTLYAATAEQVHGGEFFGPDGFLEMRGYPQKSTPSQAAQHVNDAASLWAVSVAQTKRDFTGVL